MGVEIRRGHSPTATIVTLGDITLVYSYETVVAFAVRGWGWCASENVWGTTTGKHLNAEVPGGVDRSPPARFLQLLEVVLDSIGSDTDRLTEDLRERSA